MERNLLTNNNNIILIPFGENILALSWAEFNQAIQRGKEVMGTTSTTTVTSHNGNDNKLINANGASKMTGVPASWFLESARKNIIPHIKLGKYVRFRMGDIIEAMEKRPKTTSKIIFK